MEGILKNELLVLTEKNADQIRVLVWMYTNLIKEGCYEQLDELSLIIQDLINITSKMLNLTQERSDGKFSKSTPAG